MDREGPAGQKPDCYWQLVLFLALDMGATEERIADSEILFCQHIDQSISTLALSITLSLF